MDPIPSPEKPKIVVADPVHAEGLAALQTWANVTYTPDRALIAQTPDAQALVVRAPVTEEVLRTMPLLKAIVRCGAGIDGIPKAYADAHHIKVMNTPGANADSVAEQVFASVLEVLRDIAGFAKGMRAGDWQRRNQARTHSFELKGRRLGVLGMGAIGHRVAEIGHHGFGMPVQATLMTPRKLPDFVNVVDIDTLAKTSDVLVLCCSLNEATRGLIGAAQLNSMPAGAILVNVARGAVIDEAALLAFASNPDRTVALALDVHHTSPLPQDHPLTHAPLCWLTPHIAGITADSERQMGLMTHRVLNQFFFA